MFYFYFYFFFGCVCVCVWDITYCVGTLATCKPWEKSSGFAGGGSQDAHGHEGRWNVYLNLTGARSK